ncbi:beta-N-acetylhexosaminidase [Glacieibacterium frigidum]|uniref:beta-N-acetylhexosaminidase n=1 Tax=Glacieibacterium frigidum TaxID=2593303 RepID=A0A552UEJ7_9SPHN|nr:beta-N-acetylhexosaminidase [Glacieibacterium frigidum]TRW16657.1 beta-N-acetylhexosaminidase [Glacieibacterium frigidum]
MTPLFLGMSGPVLTDDERALFAAADPAGYIVFKRNCVDPGQLLALTDALRDLAGRNVPILIDQEGGRVARLGPPHWPVFPAAAAFGALYDRAPISAIQAARLNAEAIALTLRGVGVNVDCLPLLDVPQPGAHGIIGDRAYAADPQWIAALGKATLDGLRARGVCGVIKHIPGHGRAMVDSHLDLPVVDASREELETDFAPFRDLNDAPMAMTAHVVYTALDAARCATMSPVVIDLIRSDIGFDGLLMSDDLGMQALGHGASGSNGTNDFGARALDSLAAGCDIALHCSGDFAEMRAIVEAGPVMTTQATRRLDAAMAWAATPDPREIADLVANRDALLALA